MRSEECKEDSSYLKSLMRKMAEGLGCTEPMARDFGVSKGFRKMRLVLTCNSSVNPKSLRLERLLESFVPAIKPCL